MDRIVETHRKQRLGKLLLQRWVEIGAGREHAMIERRRGPYLRQRAFRHQAFGSHGAPERAADGAGLGAAIEHRANDLGLAPPGIAVLADIAVEAQRSIVFALGHSLAFKEIDREDRRMAAVAAA